MRPRGARVRAGGAVLALGLAATALQAAPAGKSDGRSDGRSDERSNGWSRHSYREPLDLAAAALTGPGTPNVVQDAQLDDRSGRHTAEVDTTASASATCDDCTADAGALHVVYLERPTEASLDNVAVAWAQCVGCRATALSVQVVVLRSPQTVRANNRALAVNATCERCLTSAAAFQLVVVGGRKDRLSRAAHEELEQWVAQQAAAMRTAVPAADPTVAPTALRTVEDGPDPLGLLDELEALLGTQLGGAQTVERDVDVSTGEAPPADAPGDAGAPDAAKEPATV